MFGSQEYFAFENTPYNDVFGFFISGPGITGPYSSTAGFPDGSINIAVIPGSSPDLPITVSSLNANINTEFFISNQMMSTTVNSINGFTVAIKAGAVLQCGETYHIRLAIADGTDAALSSYIFLSANSFSSPEVSVLNDFDNSESTEIEIPCGLTVNLSAQVPNPEEYEFSWSTGESTQEIEVSAGSYWVLLVNDQNCSLHSDTIHVLSDNPLYFRFKDDYVFCDGESVFLKIDSLSGNPPFSYNWSNGEVTDSILVGSGTYELVLTDIDNCALTKSITINSLTKPTAFLSGEAVKCFNSDEDLSLIFVKSILLFSYLLI